MHLMHGALVAINDFPIITNCEGKGGGHRGSYLHVGWVFGANLMVQFLKFLLFLEGLPDEF